MKSKAVPQKPPIRQMSIIIMVKDVWQLVLGLISKTLHLAGHGLVPFHSSVLQAFRPLSMELHIDV